MKVAFLDRDGTFLWEPEKPVDVDPRETFPLRSLSEFKFMDGALEGIKQLVTDGFKLVMVTNQTFLGTAKHPQAIFDQIMAKIDEELAKEDIRFEFIMVCPHGPDEGCVCRKPKTGGLQPFFKEHGRHIDLEHSLMFGDRETDGEFAKNLGVRFIKIQTNKKFELPADIHI